MREKDKNIFIKAECLLQLSVQPLPAVGGQYRHPCLGGVLLQHPGGSHIFWSAQGCGVSQDTGLSRANMEMVPGRNKLFTPPGPLAHLQEGSLHHGRPLGLEEAHEGLLFCRVSFLTSALLSCAHRLGPWRPSCSPQPRA